MLYVELSFVNVSCLCFFFYFIVRLSVPVFLECLVVVSMGRAAWNKTDWLIDWYRSTHSPRHGTIMLTFWYNLKHNIGYWLQTGKPDASYVVTDKASELVFLCILLTRTSCRHQSITVAFRNVPRFWWSYAHTCFVFLSLLNRPTGFYFMHKCRPNIPGILRMCWTSSDSVHVCF